MSIFDVLKKSLKKEKLKYLSLLLSFNEPFVNLLIQKKVKATIEFNLIYYFDLKKHTYNKTGCYNNRKNLNFTAKKSVKLLNSKKSAKGLKP